MKALYLLNPQIDFCEGGALGIEGASAYLTNVHQQLETFDIVIGFKEIHCADHVSFAANHPWRHPGQILEIDGHVVTLMISHCVEGQFGSFIASPFDTTDFDEIVDLGGAQNFETDRELFEKFKGHLFGQIEKYSIKEILIMGLEHNDLSKSISQLLTPKVKKLQIGEMLKFKEL